MDALPALIILMPILVPVAVSFGMDPIHFGILVEANVGISLISPPVGVCLYVACGLSKLPLEAVIRPLIPFMIVLGPPIIAAVKRAFPRLSRKAETSELP